MAMPCDLRVAEGRCAHTACLPADPWRAARIAVVIAAVARHPWNGSRSVLSLLLDDSLRVPLHPGPEAPVVEVMTRPEIIATITEAVHDGLARVEPRPDPVLTGDRPTLFVVLGSGARTPGARETKSRARDDVVSELGAPPIPGGAA
jgi:hypothetical protein